MDININTDMNTNITKSINNNMIPVLQSRWKLERYTLKYYGLRNYPHTLERIIKLTKQDVEFIKAINSLNSAHSIDLNKNTHNIDLNENTNDIVSVNNIKSTYRFGSDNKSDNKLVSLQELLHHYRLTNAIKKLFAEGIVVDISELRKIPDTLDTAQYCTRCVANDFIIPGLEFDNSGKCALCQADEYILRDLSTSNLIITREDLLSIKNESAYRSKKNKSRFDVAIMYTGGKDSSYLLYYLAKVCNLRVLACTWTIPFMSPNARANIQAAKERLTNVEFVERNILPDQLSTMYKASMELQGNTCLCPSLAYIIFYPLLISERVPYVISGVEGAQNRNMVVNGFIPLNIYKASKSRTLHNLINLLRIIMLKSPYKEGQLATVTYLKQLAHSNDFINKLLRRVFKYRNEMVEHLCTVFNSVPEVLSPLAEALGKNDRAGNIPILANIDFNSISPGGIYDWDTIKRLLNKELGWQGTEQTGNDKGLHTSCIVEEGKDFSQFIRFRNMESMIIPFSAVELSTAVKSGNLSREQALNELKRMPGFSLESPAAYKLMCCYDKFFCII
jgi:hypothetical protein